jgi:chemotaxis protein methyltransferase CheR
VAFTFFFRDAPCIEAAVDALLPRVAGRQRVRIWDAGCAHGPEPYTVALILAARMSTFGLRAVDILATDIDESGRFGEDIAAASYPAGDLARVPEQLLDRYFEPGPPGQRRLTMDIRSRVRYQRHDLLGLRPPGEGYAMIVCKNVLLHFSPAQRIEVLRMFHHALAEDGILLLETTQPLPDELGTAFRRLIGQASVFAAVSTSS